MNRKRLTSILLLLFMLTSLLPVSAAADMWIDYPVQDAEQLPEETETPEWEDEADFEGDEIPIDYVTPPDFPAEETPQSGSETQPEEETDAQTAAPAAMPVVFYSDATGNFSELTVFDAAGREAQPYTDPHTGAMQYENYLLLPGTYRYYYHDPDGVLLDAEGSFTVDESGVQHIRLALTDTAVGMCFSGTVVNPYYSDLIPESVIPTSSTSPEESLEQLLIEVDELSEVRRGRNEVYAAGPRLSINDDLDAPGNSPVIYDNAEAAGAALKRNLTMRQKEITIRVKCGIKPTEEIWWKICWMIYDTAIRHSGAPTEGDYLRYEYGGVNCIGSAAGTETSGVYYYKFIYTPLYFTTFAQETELNACIGSILNNLMLVGKSDEQKIRAVYQYLCDHVGYDDAQDTIVFTAYDALINGKAACQGVAVAFYRMCLELGVDARVVTSIEMGHCWNIAHADGRRYYALDATWDVGKTPDQWQYYLRGRGNWLTGHTLGDEFLDGRFDAYIFPEADYDGQTGAVIQSVSLLFDGMLRIKYYFAIPEQLLSEQGACVQFSRDGAVIGTVPLSEGRAEGGCLSYCISVSVEDIGTPVQTKILDGRGELVQISSRSGTVYANGFFFSVMEYAQQMKETADSAEMRALAQALEDYGLAAQNYFKRSGNTLRSEVTSVSAADLAAWSTSVDGVKPAGFAGASISVLFEADNSLRVYLHYNAGADPEGFQYEIDGSPAVLHRRTDGACYLSVDNIAPDALGTSHRFVVSNGTDSFAVTTSVLGYARTAIERGDTDIANLCKALYLYNRAAENYFRA